MEYYKGSNAYRVKIQEREQRKLERRDNPAYERLIKTRKKEVFLVFAIMMTISLVAILRMAHISALNVEIQQAEKVLEEAMATKANLEIEYDRAIDLSYIEEVAVNSYGMTVPTKDQIVYISVEREDSVKVKGETKELVYEGVTGIN